MLNGFYEERYYSQFMIGILYERTNKPLNETLNEYLKCSELDDLRAEHILNAIIILQKLGDSISSDAKDLITKLMTFDPEKRISAKDALAHKWLTNAPSKEISAELRKDSIAKMK